ncbi:UDP-galactopyranose mutase [Pantoea sp. NPDC088449]|uniref:UDP-galactopyranose mutase n=1 Tax=Pantoea sp. NPDC088449 TaxID=3364392 RepID=UPI0038126A1C
MYDYLIVGAGLFGSTFARLATDAGKKCLIIDKRDHIAGNCYTIKKHGIHEHVYGPHIFHCNDDLIWNFVNRFAKFNTFVNRPIAINNGKVFSLPFSMYTFNAMWGVITPEEAMKKIESQRLKLNREPLNLEEQALTLVGEDIYNCLIRDYTKKQWLKDPKELPASIIKRLPIRMSWDNNYFYDKYQGIPIGGYTAMFENILEGIEVKTKIDYFANQEYWNSIAKKIVFTGKIDEYYKFEHGELEYRSLRFETETMPYNNHQGNAVVNYNSLDIPWTRMIEHKYFDQSNANDNVTIVTKEIPDIWSRNKTPYYPIGDEKNTLIFKKYMSMAKSEINTIFGGRLAEYRYYDMHQVIQSAFNKFKENI